MTKRDNGNSAIPVVAAIKPRAALVSIVFQSSVAKPI